MIVFLFVLLAGYAVRCDENNYYVIEMLEDLPTPKPFKVYWNVPTKQCKSKKIPFENLYEKFGIIQNENDYFAGEEITILYDPGLFPALLKNETSGRFRFRNGGVPQEGDLNKHLEAFKNELDQIIPDKNFDGIGIIDFESWRPVYRQNFGVLRPYKDVSLEIERKLHWWWQKKWLEAEAKRRFEESARAFMQTSLALAKQLRPRAQSWGFYGFPYCFNMASNNMVEACANNVPQENDNISWLWQESTTLFPSVYSSVSLSTSELTALIRGRVREAGRFHRRILPYFWYRYRDAGFLSQVDLNAALETLYKSNASGIIIWGSSSDVNTVQKCTKLLSYIEQVMGPAIAKYTKPRKLQDADDITTVNDTSSIPDTTKVGNDISTYNPTNVSTNKIKDLDPEYHWTPPENYTQDIKDHVAEEISKKLSNYTGPGDKNTILYNYVLTDLILNSIFNNNFSNSEDNTSTIMNVDREITTAGDKNYPSNESLSNITTLSSNVQVTETTSVSNNADTNDDEGKLIELLLKTTSNIEGANLFETTTNDNVHIETSYSNFLDIDLTEYATITSILPDKYTDEIITDISRSKNEKKTYIYDSMEDYFDVTTDLPLTTDSTESINPKIKIIVTTVGFGGNTTDRDLISSEESFTQNTTSINNIGTTMKDSLDIHGYPRENSEVNETKTFKTEGEDFYQNSSRTATITDNNEADNNSNTSTTESDVFYVKTAIEQDIYTKSPNLIENNETLQAKSKGYTKIIDYTSTKAPELNGIEDISTIETQNDSSNDEENTSLAPTSTSPEQVSGSAPRITRSQSLYCIFYIYSVSKCLCSIFGQCS